MFPECCAAHILDLKPKLSAALHCFTAAKSRNLRYCNNFAEEEEYLCSTAADVSRDHLLLVLLLLLSLLLVYLLLLVGHSSIASSSYCT